MVNETVNTHTGSIRTSISVKISIYILFIFIIFVLKYFHSTMNENIIEDL